MIRTLLVGAFVLTSSAAPVFAQGAPRAGSTEQQKACRNDVVKLCRGLEQAGDMEIYQCLQSNAAKLSKRCRDALSEGR